MPTSYGLPISLPYKTVSGGIRLISTEPSDDCVSYAQRPVWFRYNLCFDFQAIDKTSLNGLRGPLIEYGSIEKQQQNLRISQYRQRLSEGVIHETLLVATISHNASPEI